MEPNIIDELFQRICELEKTLETKDSEIQELNKKIADLTTPPPENPKKPSIVNFKAFISKKLGFCSSVQGEVAKIEFPPSMLRLPSDDPMLSRGVSTNTFISQIITEIDLISEKKKIIESEIDSKRQEILKQAEESIQKFSDLFIPELSTSNEKALRLIETITNELIGSLLIETATGKMFQFEEINTETLQVTLSQLKDSNGIALLEPKKVSDDLKLFQKYRAVIKSESESILSELNKSTINIFYQLIEVENSEKICCPVNITPEFLSLQDYEIRFNKSQSQISEVVNKTDGPVKFTTVVVSEDCGLVQTSVVEVFTSEVSSHILNIVHVHLEDMKEEVPLEGVYILPEQDWTEYKEFSQDAYGRDLRYKILVKEGRVDSILYNTGSTTEQIHFIERKISPLSLFKYNELVVKVTEVPTGLLTRDWLGARSTCEEVFSKKAPQGHCGSRYIEELPGYVDVKVVIENGEASEVLKEFSVPVCLLHQLSERETKEVEDLITRKLNEKNQKAEVLFVKVQELVDGYNLMSLKSSKEFLEELTQAVRTAKEEMNTNQGFRQKYEGLVQQAERIIRNVALDLRFNPS